MKITEQIIELEAEMKGLMERLSDLKMQVYALEEKNEHMLDKVYRQSEGGGQQQLQELYQEGYHICPENFAQDRDTKLDCLYCLSFLSEVHGKNSEG